jgi:hypothetical protein
MTLELPSGGEEVFGYERKGDILMMSFQRAAGVGLVRLGSAADKAYQRRTETAEQDGAGQPATRPESKSEDGDKPHPKSEGRSR